MNYRKFMYNMFICIFVSALFFNISQMKIFAFSGTGSGTVTAPYIITNENQLMQIKDNMSAYYKLSNNITVNGNWVPIGNYSNQFNGNLDGNNKKIFKVTITGYENPTGLFSYIGSKGTIKNLGIENIKYTDNLEQVGALAGENNGTIDNCYSTGNIVTTMSQKGFTVGGLVASNNGTIINSYSACNVQGRVRAGGFVGLNKGKITNCYAVGNVSMSNSMMNIGGFVGHANSKNSIITDCYSTGNVTANYNYDSFAGGFVGFSDAGAIFKDSFTLSKITGSAPKGSFVGMGTTSFNNCFSSAIVSGVKNISGKDTVESGINEFENSFLVLQIGKTKNISKYDIRNFTISDINGTSSIVSLSQDGVITPLSEGTCTIKANLTIGAMAIKIPITCKVTVVSKMSGDGSEYSPYIINNPEQVLYINTELDKSYKLGNDIDMISQTNFMPIGIGQLHFTGNFDGNGYTIKNVKYETESFGRIGLFSYIEEASTIKNLTVLNSSFKGSSNVGTIVGINLGTIENVNVLGNGNISGGNNTGGFVGSNKGTIMSCTIDGNMVINGIGFFTGGFVGENSGKILNCTTKAELSTNQNMLGGFIGFNTGDGLVEECQSDTIIKLKKEQANIGGFGGNLNSGTIKNCFAFGKGEGVFEASTNERLSGFSACPGAKMENCYTMFEFPNDTLTAGFIANRPTGTPSVNISSLNDSKLINCYFSSMSTKSLYGINEMSRNKIDNINKLDFSIKLGEKDKILNIDKEFKFKGTSSNPSIVSVSDDGTVSALFPGKSHISGIAEILGHNIDVEAEVYVDYMTGNGTKESPYSVSTAEQFNTIRYKTNNHFKLVNDIDLSKYETWESIGIGNNDFNGSIDGNEYKIYNIKCNDNIIPFYGVFGFIGTKGEIKNLNVDYSNFEKGGISSFLAKVNNGLIQNINVTNLNNVVLSPLNFIFGGITSVNYGKIYDCSINGSFSKGNTGMGGAVSYNYGEIKNTISNVNISGSSGVGGFVQSNNATIVNSSSNGEVKGGSGVAGFVSENADGFIVNSYSTCNVISSNSIGGGFVGLNANIKGNAKIEACYSTGTVTAASSGGGFAGGLMDGAYITNCYSTGNVSIGYDTGGGFIGESAGGNIANCYSTGSIEYTGTSTPAPNNMGSFIGKFYYGSTNIEKCYYNNERALIFPPGGIGMNSSHQIYGKTDSEMKTMSTFQDWNFNSTWSINEGISYPTLGMSNIPSTSIKINKENITLSVDSEAQLDVIVIPSGSIPENLVWSSRNENIATVTNTGLVKTLSYGKTQIFAQTEDASQFSVCNITVNADYVKPQQIVFPESEYTIEKGASLQLEPEILPSASEFMNKNIDFFSSDNNVITVDKNGLVTAINKGIAFIWAIAEDGNAKTLLSITVMSNKPDIVEPVMINVGNISGKTSSIVSVPISVKNNSGISAFRISLSFDKDVITPISVKKGFIISEGQLYSNIDDINTEVNNINKLTMFWIGTTDIKEDGELLNVEFKISDKAKDISSPLNITYNEDEIVNQNGEKVGLNKTDGSIEVVRYTLGDVNGDSVIDSNDAVKIYRYLGGWDLSLTEDETKAADVYPDGEINSKDAIKLAQYLAGYEGVILGKK